MANRLLRQFKPVEGVDPQEYVMSVLQVMWHYPEEIVEKLVDPFDGLAGKHDWLPSIHQIKALADELNGPRVEASRRAMLERQTLREREEMQRIEASRATRPTLEAVEEELAQRGIFLNSWKRRNAHRLGPDGKLHEETPASVQAKLGLSEAQWDALPKTNALTGSAATAAEGEEGRRPAGDNNGAQPSPRSSPELPTPDPERYF